MLEKMHQKNLTGVVVVISSAAALMLGIFAIQNLQSKFFPLQSVSAKDAIAIVMLKQNITRPYTNDFSTKYVYVKGDGKVFQADESSNQIGKYLMAGMATDTGGSYFAWAVRDPAENVTYYVDSQSGAIISNSTSK